jgi:hypothetical protein
MQNIKNEKEDQGFNYDPNIVGVEFVKYFYNCIDNNPTLLVDSIGNFLFRERSTYKIQGADILGPENIMQTLINLKQRGIQHEISNIDILSSGLRRLNILVTGKMNLDGFHYSFTEYFHIGCGKKKSEWFIQSSILRTL